MSQNLPIVSCSFGIFCVLRHLNHFLLASANNRNIIITYDSLRPLFKQIEIFSILPVFRLLGEIPAGAIKVENSSTVCKLHEGRKGLRPMGSNADQLTDLSFQDILATDRGVKIANQINHLSFHSRVQVCMISLLQALNSQAFLFVISSDLLKMFFNSNK